MALVSTMCNFEANTIFLWLYRVYTEEQPGDAAIMLFIKDLREEDSGLYRCSGIYASNEEMFAEVKVSTFSKLLHSGYHNCSQN